MRLYLRVESVGNDCAMRQRICDGLSAFGVVVKREDNDGVRGVEKLLSAPG